MKDYTFYRDVEGTFTHYRKGERGKKIPFQDAAAFVIAYMDTLSKEGKKTFMMKTQGKAFEWTFSQLVKNATIEQERIGDNSWLSYNPIYLQPVNEERSNWNILVLVNKDTCTYAKLGQTDEDKIYPRIHLALHATPNREIAGWYQEFLQAHATDKKKDPSSNLYNYVLHLLGQPEFHLDTIENISNNPLVPNYAYFDLQRIAELPATPTPTWDQFTSMFCSEEKVDLFKSWIWSVFDADNTGRQWLWIQGNGEEGKSKMYSTILRYMDQQFGKGRAYFATTNVSHESNRFFFSSAEGKRLCVFGDTRETGLLRNENFLKLSGYDTTVVEGKNKQPYSARLYSKLLLVSNSFPEVNFASRAELSRIVMLRLQPYRAAELLRTRVGESTFEDRLFGEFEAFLRSCHESYVRTLKPGSYDLRIPDGVREDMYTHCQTRESLIEQYFVKYMLEFDPAYQLPIAALQSHLRAFAGDELQGRTLKFHMQNIRMLLEDTYHCRYSHLEVSSGLKVPYVVGCKVKSSTSKKFTDIFREDLAKTIDVTEL